jgi:hypothetical protein
MNKETKQLQNGREISRNKQVISSLLTELCEGAPEAALARLEVTQNGLTEEQVEARQEQ